VCHSPRTPWSPKPPVYAWHARWEEGGSSLGKSYDLLRNLSGSADLDLVRQGKNPDNESWLSRANPRTSLQPSSSATVAGIPTRPISRAISVALPTRSRLVPARQEGHRARLATRSPGSASPQ